jgi:hypothetical protein
MKEAIAKRWVRALRSGEYRQARRVLWRKGRGESDSFCCLGVLTDLYVRSGGSESGWGDEVLTQRVQEWAGLKFPNGNIPFADICLSRMNDEGHSFAGIADVIEREWESL